MDADVLMDFVKAVSEGDDQKIDAVVSLLDESDKTEAFYTCVKFGSLDGVKRMLKHVDPTDNNSGALRIATVIGHNHLLPVLIPVSNVAAARMQLIKDGVPKAKLDELLGPIDAETPQTSSDEMLQSLNAQMEEMLEFLKGVEASQNSKKFTDEDFQTALRNCDTRTIGNNIKYLTQELFESHMISAVLNNSMEQFLTLLPFVNSKEKALFTALLKKNQDIANYLIPYCDIEIVVEVINASVVDEETKAACIAMLQVNDESYIQLKRFFINLDAEEASNMTENFSPEQLHFMYTRFAKEGEMGCISKFLACVIDVVELRCIALIFATLNGHKHVLYSLAHSTAIENVYANLNKSDIPKEQHSQIIEQIKMFA